MLELIVNGRAYSGWKKARVRKSVEELAHSFSLSLSDRWTENQQPIEVEAGQSVEIKIDDETVITGFIDEDVISYSKSDYSIDISGRSKTGDLVDCSALFKSGQWKKATLITIANDLCAAYDLNILAPVTSQTFRKFSIESGESIFECLARAASMFQLLLQTDARGNLVFERGGSIVENATIERGVNVISGSRTNSWRDIYSGYYLQNQNAGDDNHHGSAASSPSYFHEDPTVTRNRELLVHPSGQLSSGELRDRASWEVNTRWGSARRLTYTLVGWGHAGGLWKPNRIVRVKDDMLRVDDDLLIVSVDFEQTLEGGTVTHVELTRPEAFDIAPLPRKSARKGGLW